MWRARQIFDPKIGTAVGGLKSKNRKLPWETFLRPRMITLQWGSPNLLKGGGGIPSHFANRRRAYAGGG